MAKDLIETVVKWGRDEADRAGNAQTLPENTIEQNCSHGAAISYSSQTFIWPQPNTKNFVSPTERCDCACQCVYVHALQAVQEGRGQHADRHFPSLSGPISVWPVNGEHKTYLKATFTTWLIPLHCVISRCHISPPHVCLNALPSTRWLVSLGWLPPESHSRRAPYPFTSSLRRWGGVTLYCTFSFSCWARYQTIPDTKTKCHRPFLFWLRLTRLFAFLPWTQGISAVRWLSF